MAQIKKKSLNVEFLFQVTEILTPPITLMSAIREGDMNAFEDILNSGRYDVDQTNKVSNLYDLNKSYMYKYYSIFVFYDRMVKLVFT